MRKLMNAVAAVAVALSLFQCSRKTDQQGMKEDTLQAQKKITVEKYGTLPGGRAVLEYTLINRQGMTMKVINYGGIVTSLTAPDRNNVLEDVVLGFDSLSQYVKDNPYFGCLIGRYGNRIAKGRFSLAGKEYTLATNNGVNHLHGGIKGFDKVFWNIEEYRSDEGPALRLTYLSKDMEEGYPGNLDVEVIYILTDKNEWKISYKASTDRETIVNLTQHSYFNLSGDTKRNTLDHELYLNADRFVPVDETLIPTGELKAVAETPFDFTTPTVIGSRIEKDDRQLKVGGGYDHCWVFKDPGDSLKLGGTLHDPTSGRVLSFHTTEPGVQFYSGNFLDGSLKGKYESVYEKRHGLCLETQHFPDSPNQKNFPSVVLKPGETYRSQTVYSFSVK